MKKKLSIVTLLTIVMTMCFGMTAFASPKTMPDGTVFDAEYYAKTYPDVASAIGTDENALYQHYDPNNGAGRPVSIMVWQNLKDFTRPAYSIMGYTVSSEAEKKNDTCITIEKSVFRHGGLKYIREIPVN